MQREKASRKPNLRALNLHFSHIHDAHNVLWSALLPLTPFRALTPEDIATADPALALWETSSDSISILSYDNGKPPEFSGAPGRANTNLLLAESMLRFCDYGAGLPDIAGTEETAALRQRFVRLRRHIERALLAEARSDERLDRQDRSDAQCDLDLVRDWATEIQDELLNPGQRTEHWTYESLPWTLGYLTAWDDIEFSVLTNSGITSVMRDIVYAPTIPVVSYTQPIRNWAASLLRRWALRPEAEALNPTEKARLGLEALPETPQLPEQNYTVPNILYRTGDIARDFQELREALTEAGDDHSRIFRALDKMDGWEAEALSSQGFRDALLQLQMTLRHPAAEVGDRMYASIRKFTIPTHIERRVTGFSHHTPPARGPPFGLTFRDKNALPGAIPSLGSYGGAPSDKRTWEDVSVEAHATDPINVLFGACISAANARHRHPLAPLTGFSIASTPEPFCTASWVGKTGAEAQELQSRLWEVRIGRFVQGQVSDLQLTAGNVLYYNRSNFSRVSVPELSMKQPGQRTLPPACEAPAHWIRPAAPPGGEALWQCLPSLSFVGNGDDFYPGATTPAAIASHVYVPRTFDHARLGIYPHAAYRREPTKDSTPMKFEPPLSAAQALALLGRAIQYEVPAVPPPDAPPKKKRRKGPPPVYWGVVWGVDVVGPAGPVLRIFTGGDYQETSATLKVGAPCAVPAEPIDTTCAFTPKWVGALVLDDDLPEEMAPPPPPINNEMDPDRLLRILALAAESPHFEVGIDGDCVVLAGEIALHGIDADAVEKIPNCRTGIWQGGRDDPDTERFAIWVRWLRAGSIDLRQPPEAFVAAREDEPPLEWSLYTSLSVDGGCVSLLARGVTAPEAVCALTGTEEEDVEGFVECVVLHGAEEGTFHIPGGVSTYTGGDGAFEVYTARAEGQVVGIKIVG
ncbi:hypothetical protein B0H17DRAFT_1190837 [Mycena rosella]|uniref:Uncharacterized protein n=1 Tax=Mycena rosella TaxID=1033263 RepID=A0AAD7MBK9_MYCRO|nr:hypothetical protein B0H17DRAFT_1190837 [Mycena rosella]